MMIRWPSIALALGLVAAFCLPAGARTTRSLAGQLNLHNDQWDAVQVEVRIGAAGSCDLNTAAWVRTLHKGQTWAVVATVPVCWRREATPGGATLTTAWTAWQQTTLAPRVVVDAEL